MGSKGLRQSFFGVHKEVLHTAYKGMAPAIFLILLLDALFYGSLTAAVFYASEEVRERYDQVSLPETVEGLSYNQAQAALAQSKAFLNTLMISLGGLFLLGVAAWVLLKGWIWRLTLGLRPTRSFFTKYLLFSLPWLTIWFGVFFGLQLMLDPMRGRTILLVLMVLFIVITNSVNALFALRPGRKAVREGVGVVFTNPLHMLLTYGAFLATWMLLGTIAGQLPNSLAVLSVLAILFFTFARYYVATLTKILAERR